MAWVILIMTATYQVYRAQPATNVSSIFSWLTFVVGVPTFFLAWMSPQEFTVWGGSILTLASMAVVAFCKGWDLIEKRLAKRQQRLDRRSGSHRKPPKEREI